MDEPDRLRVLLMADTHVPKRARDLPAEVWEQVERHHAALSETGELAEKRSRQQVEWTWALVRDQLMSELTNHPGVRSIVGEVEEQVRSGELTASMAADRLLRAFRGA